MSVSHGWLSCVYLRSDHYLHQHDGSGPIDSTWLGGMNTFTTIRDRRTQLAFLHLQFQSWMLTWFSVSSKLCFHVIYVVSIHIDSWFMYMYFYYDIIFGMITLDAWIRCYGWDVGIMQSSLCFECLLLDYYGYGTPRCGGSNSFPF